MDQRLSTARGAKYIQHKYEVQSWLVVCCNPLPHQLRVHVLYMFDRRRRLLGIVRILLGVWSILDSEQCERYSVLCLVWLFARCDTSLTSL